MAIHFGASCDRSCHSLTYACTECFFAGPWILSPTQRAAATASNYGLASGIGDACQQKRLGVLLVRKGHGTQPLLRVVKPRETSMPKNSVAEFLAAVLVT